MAIKAVALDVDGVLTDNTFWWGPNGEEWKRFAFSDVMGISLASKSGMRFALISGEPSPLVDRYAAKLGIAHVFSGSKDKAAALGEFATRSQLSVSEVCFLGNDINDLAAMALCGMSAAPADAHPEVRARVDVVTRSPGGHGAVREVLDLLSQGETRPDSAHFQRQLGQHKDVMSRFVAGQGAVLLELTDVFLAAFRRGNKLLFCGNGGSAADSQHAAAEFVNRFRFDRPPLPAMALTVDTSVLTCIGNDAAFDQVFARQVEALARPGDVVVGLSTSGKSANVLEALQVARRKGAVTVGFTGERGPATLSPLCEHLLVVPSADTARIQECHEFAFHSIADLIEQVLFKPQTPAPVA